MPCRDYESDSYSSPTDSWQYRDLKERADKEQRKQERIRLRRAALRKLSEEEKIALGLKKSKDKDIEEDVTQDLLAVADKILKRKAKEEWQI